MGDVSVADGTHLGPKHGSDGGRLPVEREKFDLKRLALGVDVHNRADIAGFQSLLRQVTGEHNAVVFFHHGYSSFNPKSDLAARLDEGERFRFYAREINKLAGMVNINTHNVPISIEINHDAGRDFTDLGSDFLGEVNIERVCVRGIMKFHRLCSRSLI